MHVSITLCHITFWGLTQVTHQMTSGHTFQWLEHLQHRLECGDGNSWNLYRHNSLIWGNLYKIIDTTETDNSQEVAVTLSCKTQVPYTMVNNLQIKDQSVSCADKLQWPCHLHFSNTFIQPTELFMNKVMLKAGMSMNLSLTHISSIHVFGCVLSLLFKTRVFELTES